MSNPLPVSPQGAPPPVTPADSPSDPSGYASVTPHGRGPAPYDIQAPMEDLTAAFGGANSLGGAGFLYPQGERQAQAAQLLNSPAGFASGAGYNVDAGYHGGGGGWPNDVEPDATGP